MSINEFVSEFTSITSTTASDRRVTLVGRIDSRRTAGSKLIFMDIIQSSAKVQVYINKAKYPEMESSLSTLSYAHIHSILRRGDIIGITGTPMRSATGELSIAPTSMQLLSPCLHDIPLRHVDSESRFRHRHLDLLVRQQDALKIFNTRSTIITTVRQFLLNHGFMEVETPILWSRHGGANARPFTTTSTALGDDHRLHLRIAPELFLKQLLIGGIDRVFEIGKVFRNESIDLTHNPEFTSCEFYWAHSNYNELMNHTEHMIRQIVHAVNGTSTFVLPVVNSPTDTTASSSSSPIIIDVSKPFGRIEIIPTLERLLGTSLPSNLNDDSCIQPLLALAESKGIAITPPYTPAHILGMLPCCGCHLVFLSKKC
jgi:lysyl-tRNA synthetase class 2